jgi:UDP-N-acetylmuramoyl-tripeptide--D-alanyl-D-alanine ligase
MNIEEIYKIYLEYPSVQTDTRKLNNGDIYFALKGDNFNGNHFVSQAFEKGANYCVVDEVEYQINDKCILVEDVLSCLQALATHHRKQFVIPFIAITGSNGKTTTKELMMAVLSSKYKTYATEGNLNNHIGVPLTILKIKKDAQMAIIEMGANHQKEIAFYCNIALPTHGLINNCGKAHLEGFGGIEGVKKGKGELYDFLKNKDGIIFRNSDLEYLNEMSIGIEKQVTYGEHQANFIGKSYTENSFLQVAVLTQGLECTIHTQLVGEYNLANVLGAVAVGSTFDIHINDIKKSIEEYSPSNSRSQLMKIGTNTVILDAYNANPTSMVSAINNFSQLDYPNKIIMIGAMMELGDESINEHQKIIELLAQSNWKQVVLVGGNFNVVKHSFIYFENSTLAQKWFVESAFQNTAFLIKGSRAFQMEKIIN